MAWIIGQGFISPTAPPHPPLPSPHFFKNKHYFSLVSLQRSIIGFEFRILLEWRGKEHTQRKVVENYMALVWFQNIFAFADFIHMSPTPYTSPHMLPLSLSFYACKSPDHTTHKVGCQPGDCR